jgi:hypothetical protein
VCWGGSVSACPRRRRAQERDTDSDDLSDAQEGTGDPHRDRIPNFLDTD